MCCWTCGQWLSSFEGSTRNSLIRSLESELLSRGLSFARQFLHNNTFYEYAYYLSIFLNMLIIFLFITVLYTGNVQCYSNEIDPILYLITMEM